MLNVGAFVVILNTNVLSELVDLLFTIEGFFFKSLSRLNNILELSLQLLYVCVPFLISLFKFFYLTLLIKKQTILMSEKSSNKISIILRDLE